MAGVFLKQLNPSLFLSTLLEKTKDSVALVLHQSADPDAIGSAAALAQLLSQQAQIRSQIFAESLNRSANNIATFFHIELGSPEALAQHSTIVLIDLNNFEQLGDLTSHLPQKGATIFCIDHHTPHKDLPQLTNYLLYNDQIRSTAELILFLWEASTHKPSADTATQLACGLVYDSRHFHIAMKNTFEHFLSLLQYGADYERVLALLSTPLDKSERIARLKATQRVVLYDEFGLLIAATKIRSYEASVCRALIGLGADIAIACADKRDEVRISARSNLSVNQETGLDLARDVMEPLGEMIGGAGGGHPSAAGANGVASSDHALGLALQLIRKALKAHPTEFQPASDQGSDR
ncbi:MAG: bifunctional oligoribonuclease/PAP phosphatase NrnA [Promethearchaeota archaeon]